MTTPDPRTETTAPGSAPDGGAPTLAVDDVDGTRKRLTFFTVMAFVVGVGLLVLVVEMVLSYGFRLKGTDNPLYWWPQPHGFIYMANQEGIIEFD